MKIIQAVGRSGLALRKITSLLDEATELLSVHEFNDEVHPRAESIVYQLETIATQLQEKHHA